MLCRRFKTKLSKFSRIKLEEGQREREREREKLDKKITRSLVKTKTERGKMKLK